MMRFDAGFTAMKLAIIGLLCIRDSVVLRLEAFRSSYDPLWRVSGSGTESGVFSFVRFVQLVEARLSAVQSFLVY